MVKKLIFPTTTFFLTSIHSLAFSNYTNIFLNQMENDVVQSLCVTSRKLNHKKNKVISQAIYTLSSYSTHLTRFFRVVADMDRAYSKSIYILKQKQINALDDNDIFSGICGFSLHFTLNTLGIFGEQCKFLNSIITQVERSNEKSCAQS